MLERMQESSSSFCTKNEVLSGLIVIYFFHLSELVWFSRSGSHMVTENTGTKKKSLPLLIVIKKSSDNSNLSRDCLL